jgi:glycine hydroxymethyltransferase
MMESAEERINYLIQKRRITEIKRAILNAVGGHDGWRAKECIDLHAGKNIMSQQAREVLASPGLVNNSVSGAIGRRNASGTCFIDEIESLTVHILRELFRAKYVEYRGMSGSVVNGIALCALTRPGDVIMVVPKKNYGHYTFSEKGYPRHLKLRVEEIPFTNDSAEIDMGAFRKRVKEVKPSVIVVGTSIFLFPPPLKEIRDVADSVSAKVLYDGAHVLGLIAGRSFQAPLAEGAHILVGSTQKTFPGPIGGILACNDEEIAHEVFRVTDGLFSNYGNNRIAALAITAAEMLRFGRDYTKAIAENSRALSVALESAGFDVFGKSHGYTVSHQVTFDANFCGGANSAREILEKANIISTHFALTKDYPNSLENPNGLRLGVSTVTRIGMGAREMKKIAEFIYEALRGSQKVNRIKHEVQELAADFQTVHYSFDLKKSV